MKDKKYMKIEYINPFVDSTSTILREMLKTDVRRGEMYVKTSSAPILGVAVFIALFGDLNGRVVFDMSEDTALTITSEINMLEITGLDDEVKTSLKELTGLITGQAILALRELGFTVTHGPPVIITGRNLEIHDPGVEALISSVEMRQGSIDINIAVEENTSGT